MRKHMKLTILLAAAIVSCSSVLLTDASIAQSQPSPKRIEITAKKFSFEPSEITVKRGEPVVLVLKSEDVAHGIRFRELNMEINVRAGATGEAQFTPQKTGDFVGHCSVFCGAGHGSMQLKLHVVE
jgi:cytochrome c oxidase subunit II